MYIPELFHEQDREEIVRVIRAHPFAMVVTTGADGIVANHLPLLFHPDRGPHGTAVGHMALSNPQWKTFESSPVLAIFQGPNCYVSPRTYVTPVNAPTWNFVAIHLHGRAKLVKDYDSIHTILAETIHTFESGSPNPWNFEVPEDYKRRLIPHVMGFEIPVERIEAKFKLNQNRPDVDRRAVIAHLGTKEDAVSREMHGIMQRFDAR